MSRPSCGKKTKKGKYRKHTPIVSERQRRFFRAEYGRAKRGEAKETEMSIAELRRHIKEAKGKSLPETSRKSKKRRRRKK